MGVIASNTFLTAFSIGTFVGATSTYFIMRIRPRMKLKKDNIWKEGLEERYEFEDVNDEYRLIIGVRNDLKMQKGKVAAQCGHASVAAYAKALERQPKTLRNWLKFGGTKITVKIDSENEMFDLESKAKELHVLSSIVRDAGQTQVLPGTRTVIAVGPAPKSVLDEITGHLKLY